MIFYRKNERSDTKGSVIFICNSTIYTWGAFHSVWEKQSESFLILQQII